MTNAIQQSQPRHYLEVTMSNRNVIKTKFNGSVSDAINYYIGKAFNVGIDGDKMVYGCAITIDGIEYNPSTHKYISERAHEKNLDLIAIRTKLFTESEDVRVGEFLMVDGGFRRFTHDWDHSIQTSDYVTQHGKTGSFHMGKRGGVSYSGGLQPMIRKDAMEYTGEKMLGEFWMFNEDYATGHNGINFMCECRIYKMKA